MLNYTCWATCWVGTAHALLLVYVAKAFSVHYLKILEYYVAISLQFFSTCADSQKSLIAESVQGYSPVNFMLEILCS